MATKIKNLHIGDVFRFQFGQRRYVITYIKDTDEIGWLINFMDIRSGQTYQYQENWKGTDFSPTDKMVIKVNSVPQPTSKNYWRNLAPWTDTYFEKYFHVKMKRPTITK